MLTKEQQWIIHQTNDSKKPCIHVLHLDDKHDLLLYAYNNEPNCSPLDVNRYYVQLTELTLTPTIKNTIEPTISTIMPATEFHAPNLNAAKIEAIKLKTLWAKSQKHATMHYWDSLILTTATLDDSISVLQTPIEDLELSTRSYNCLHRYGINTIYDLTNMSMHDVKHIRNIGLASVNEIQQKLTKLGLSLRES